MNNITPAYNINNCYLPTFKQKEVNNNIATNPINSNISMNGMDALANYNKFYVDVTDNTPEYTSQTLEEHLNSLKTEGYKDGIDYILKEKAPDTHWLEIINKDGNVTDRIEYIDGQFAHSETSTYKNGKLLKRIGRNKDRIETSEKIYYKDNYPQEKFTKSGINYKTTPEQFINYLEKNNIKYKVEYEGEENNNRSVTLNEHDKNGKVVRSYWWYYGENKFNEEFLKVAVSELNENEEEVRRISFDKEKTNVCDYNYLAKTKDYDNAKYDIKSLTKAGITYHTTPEQYIEYLKTNNMQHRIKKHPEFSKDIQIDVMDNNGKVLTSTSWIYKQNNNDLERIYHLEMFKSGRQRFDFYPKKTHTMTLRYIN